MMADTLKLLPRSSKEFSSKKYWDEFFAKRSEKTFEWYGDYDELSGVLRKYVRPADKILIIGCGNSNIGSGLYDAGCHEVTNIDISEGVISEMTRKHEHLYPDMKYIQMDMLQTSFESEKLSVVLDKGTLDALMSDKGNETMDKARALFAEVARLLRTGGRYVCVSLLQEHIAVALFEYFLDLGWLIRVVELNLAREESSEFFLPVFVVVLTKFIKRPGIQPVLEYVGPGDVSSRVTGVEELVTGVKRAQYQAWLFNKLKTSVSLEEQHSVELWDSGSVLSPRYTLHIVSSNHSAPDKRFAVFIVPEGRETEWLFSSEEGRQQLAQSAGFGRLVVVTLSRDHAYHDLEEIKAELSPKVMQLAPKTSGKKLFPFLSLGDDIKQRNVQCRGHSDLSGDYVVEDVNVDGRYHRRLIFLNNRNVVQSEVTLKSGSRSSRKKVKASSVVAPPTVDHSILSFHYYTAVVSGLALLHNYKQCLGDDLDILVLGLGGGSLAMFLHNTLPKVKVTAVDLDPAVVKVATEWFGVVRDSRMNVVVDDALNVVQQAATKGVKYDVIVLDIDAKEVSTGLSCPPAAFLTSDWLSGVSKTLRDTGVYIVNLVCRNTSLRQQVVTSHANHFASLASTRLADTVNEILIGSQQVAALSDLEARSSHLRTALNKTGTVSSEQVDAICERLKDMHLVTMVTDTSQS